MASGDSKASRHKALYLVGAIVVLALLFMWRPRWGMPITMHVFDEVGQPLAGVHVVATWQLKGGMEGGNDFGVLMVREAVTDASGKFEIPRWGPRSPRALQACTSLKDNEPELLFFKSGYRVEAVRNWNYKAGFFIRDFAGDDGQVMLKPFTGTPREYWLHLGTLRTSLETLRNEAAPCEWKKIPKMLHVLGEHERMLASGSTFEGGFVAGLLNNEDSFKKKGCGSVRDFFGSTQ